MLSLGVVLPFLAALITPVKILQYNWVHPFIQFFGITSTKQLLLLFTLAFVAIVFLSGFMRLALLWTNTRLSFAMGIELGNDIYRRTLYQPYITHVNRNSSEIIDGISNKVNSIVNDVFLPVLNIVSATVILCAVLFVLVFLAPWMTIISFSGFGLSYGLMIGMTRKRLWKNSQQIANESTRVVKILQEGLGGIRDIIIDSSQSTYCTAYQKADLLMRRAQSSTAFIGNSPKYVVESLGMILIAAVAYIFVQKPDGAEHVIPLLAMIALGAQRLLPLLQQIYGALTTIQGGRASMLATLQFLEQPLPVFAVQENISALEFNNYIYLNQVSFCYDSDMQWIIDKLSLKIPKGSRIGFIGVTGSGKSTLMDIIMGLLSPTKGAVEVDGKAITPENCRAWQSHIAHVPQHIYLSDSSIEENIAFGVAKYKINRNLVREAAFKAQLADFIETCPHKYETVIGERGIRLSGGQRQRIGIARALYKQADVIVFDEATSALDNETEQCVMQLINNLDKDKTILMIAHRLTTLKGCSKIVELSNGGISNVSTYQEMMAYREMI